MMLISKKDVADRLVDGVIVAQSDDEKQRIADRWNADNAKEAAERPMREWLERMNAADHSEMPRWAEEVIEKIGTAGLSDVTVGKYEAKLALRGDKPK